MGGGRETYRESQTFAREFIGRRTAQANAGFLLPNLRAGMLLLDCGCGPGNITIDLAELVAPGEVVGIDVREEVLQTARAAAEERAVRNVTFRTASVYTLPFQDGSFDAACALSLLQYLSDPLAALSEIRRVLRPGGVVGIADPAWHRQLRVPTNPMLDAWDALKARVVTHNGGNPFYAGAQRALLRQAGFIRTEGHARIFGGQGAGGSDAAGTLEDTRRIARRDVAQLRGTARATALEQGWADMTALEAMAGALTAWGEDADAFYVLPICCAIGWT